MAGLLNPTDLGTKCHPGPRLRQLVMMQGVEGMVAGSRRSTGAVQRSLPVNPEVIETVMWPVGIFESIAGVRVQTDPVYGRAGRRSTADSFHVSAR